MRKLLIIVAAITFMALVSCSTTITVPYMQPSIIDMGGHRNLAVASVIPYKGYSAPSRYVIGADIHTMGFHVYSGYTVSTADSVADYASRTLYSELSATGFFNLLPPESTDMVLERGRFGADISREFRRLGYDAVLIPRITGMSVNETIYSEPYEDWWVDSEGEKHCRIEFNYYYKQIASIDYTLTVIDTETGSILGQRTYSDTAKREDVLDRSWVRLDDVSYLFRRMINSFSDDILRLLVPTEREYNVSLMSNKPKNESAEAAYEAASDGNLLLSQSIFLSEWEGSHHLPSGYNAALIMAASGDYDGAIDLLSDIMAVSGNADVRTLYRDLVSIRSRNEQAMGQVTGESSVHSSGAVDGNGIYALVMGI